MLIIGQVKEDVINFVTVKPQISRHIGRQINLVGKSISYAKFEESIRLEVGPQRRIEIRKEDLIGVVVGIWQAVNPAKG